VKYVEDHDRVGRGDEISLTADSGAREHHRSEVKSMTGQRDSSTALGRRDPKVEKIDSLLSLT
jgi:hypothetical protein